MYSQVKVASLVEVRPSTMIITPSFKKSKIWEGMIHNASKVPVTFKLKTTNSNFLTAMPSHGVVMPSEGHLIFIKMHRVQTPAFVHRKDHLSVYIAPLLLTGEYNRPEVHWKEPTGPPEICVHRVINVRFLMADKIPTNKNKSESSESRLSLISTTQEVAMDSVELDSEDSAKQNS